tara:strand:+ start:66025 stop:67206 length:1182 start_codon:yes stop_codon:yes gene_type:complete
MHLTLEIQISGTSAITMGRRGRILTVGRDPDADFALPDIDSTGIASARHAQFEVDGNTLLVTDLGSSNGTFVDGDRLTEPRRFVVGEAIELGLGGPVVRILNFDTAVTPAGSGGFREPTGTLLIAAGAVIVAIVVLLIGWIVSDGAKPDLVVPVPRVPKPFHVLVPVISEPVLVMEVQPLNEVSRAVGCLGFRFDVDELHGDETAWLIAPDKLVTTARIAGRLLKLKEVDSKFAFELAVAFGPERAVGIRNVRLHPKYDFDNPGDPGSLLHDVAVLTLEEPVDDRPVCKLADPGVEISLESELRLVGYENRTPPNTPLDFLQMKRRQLKVSITGSELPAGTSTPVFQTGVAVTRGLSGAPVFDQSGRVVGLLTQRNGKGVMVPVSVIRELVKH